MHASCHAESAAHFTRCIQSERTQVTHVRRRIVGLCICVRPSRLFSPERTSCSSSLFLSEGARLRLCMNQCHPSVERRAVATSSPLFSSPSVLRIGAPAERSPTVLNRRSFIWQYSNEEGTELRRATLRAGFLPSSLREEEGFRRNRASAFNWRF